ncbi:molybdenum cofactor biosynthetic protein [Zymoseptoria brevis]|uniref:Adenylyltransferase and sulfurtransferase uba4 n=1 Tax=Zymoseptoria brevis TaxID=1047168 RepID=A0A0F4GQV5_9PEZI|nr:molybdenum cofactor biosynthetic protein [Zymoseptoria brevis]
MVGNVASLREQIARAETHLQSLRQQLTDAEERANRARQLEQAYSGGFPPEWMQETLSALGGMESPEVPGYEAMDDVTTSPPNHQIPQPKPSRWPLSAEEYKRYGRQMIMPEIGLHGQIRMKKAKVLIVGVGGLGCPAAAYLAGAGVGTIGLMDGDTVELSNLHRQVAHSTSRVGKSKVDSAHAYLSDLNPLVNYDLHPSHLTPTTALQIFAQYDLILDCTDHPTSRYLISDTAVLARKPLVSASALRTEGQLIVLNNPPSTPGDPSGGPCYRCIWPRPPPAESVVSCGEGGVLGPVVGTMGMLQALEAIKLLAAPTPDPLDELEMLMADPTPLPPSPTLLMFSAYNSPPFRSVRMRRRHATCAACSSVATITPHTLLTGSMDYAAFCGLTQPVNLLAPDRRVAAWEFARLPRDGSNVLIDVRDETQYKMCALRGSLNVPWTGDGGSWVEKAVQSGALAGQGPSDYYVVCRFGNDSQMAAKAIEDVFGLEGNGMRVKDIKGGFRAWREEVDPEWPDY